MKKKLLSFSLAMVIIGSAAAYSYASQDVVKGKEVSEDMNVTLKADSKPLNRNPEPVLKGNADKLGLQSQSFKATKSSVLDEKTLKEKNAEVKLAEYMTYADYLELAGTDALSTEIAEDRVVLAVQVYYPDGFEHIKAGLIKNCLATGLYDAETGEYLGGTFETIE